MQDGGEMSDFTQSIKRIYDQGVELGFSDDYYDHSDFLNFGYWLEDTQSPREACENLMEKLLDFIPEQRGTILDVACGKGATTRYLLKYYKPENVTGINISDKQLRICRKNAPRCNFSLMDATQLKFPDNSFDNIICVEAAFHFDTRDRFLQEVHRVLKPGGRLVLSDLIAIVSPWARLLPAANYVRDLSEYKEKCLRANFVDVTVVDATAECWEGYCENMTYFLWESLRSGKRSLDRFCGGVARLRRTDSFIQYYILASCTK
jgi:ubiquinone/menaquinone biosynthesis C-methylase UbiE